VRTINQQSSHVGSERVAAMTVRQALRSLGVKESTAISGDWHHRSASASPEGLAIRLPGFVDAVSRLALQSSNDDVSGSPSVGAVQVGIPPIEHPSAIAYIASCNSDRRLIYVSSQIGNLGFAPEDLLDRPDLRLKQVHEDDFARFEQELRHSCMTAEKFSCHYRMYDGQGKVRWFHDEASVVCDEAGAPLFIRGVMLDISDKKRMEAELADHRYYLERNVERRTRELMKRIEMLESCNAALCSQLSSARMENAALHRQLEILQPEVPESEMDCAAESPSR
jgi:PAS domain S-box-containing protein